jgi:2-beta-glucuronyltransferase
VHEAGSKRKVDFHFWADVLAARGISVDFVTVGFSPITLLKKDGRKYKGPFNEWVSTRPYERKFLWCPPYHPFSLGKNLLNKISGYIFSFYAHFLPKSLLKGISDADVFIVENGAGLLLIPRLAHKFPNAKFIYSVCDRIETLNYHPIILQSEKTALKNVDLIRVPAAVMIDDYSQGLNIDYIAHGLQKNIFDACNINPYGNPRNIVSVGDMLFDEDAIRTMAQAFPEHTFHLFGKKAHLKEPLRNVISYGEKPFDDIVPYIKYADIGLAPYRPALNADYLSQSSMKMIQYTYCQLPILAPDFAAGGRDHVIGYDPANKDSIITAMQKALMFDRTKIDKSSVMDWETTVDRLFAGLSISHLK